MNPLRWLALLICACLGVACAPTTAYVAARNFETGAAQFVDVGADAWHAYSHQKFENCKDAVADFQSFLQCANAWEEDSVKVADKAIVGAREAVHQLDNSLATADAVKATDYSGGVAKVVAAITEMYNTLTALGAKLPAFKVQ